MPIDIITNTRVKELDKDTLEIVNELFSICPLPDLTDDILSMLHEMTYNVKDELGSGYTPEYLDGVSSRMTRLVTALAKLNGNLSTKQSLLRSAIGDKES